MHSSPSSSFFWSLGHRILRAQDSLQRLGPSERCNRGTFFTDHMLYRQDPQIRDKVSRKTGTTVQGCGVPVGVAIGGFSERGTPRGFHHRLPGDPATKEAVNCGRKLDTQHRSISMHAHIHIRLHVPTTILYADQEISASQNSNLSTRSKPKPMDLSGTPRRLEPKLPGLFEYLL